jgi:hypothetical protein
MLKEANTVRIRVVFIAGSANGDGEAAPRLPAVRGHSSATGSLGKERHVAHCRQSRCRFGVDPLANVLEEELALDLDLGRGLAPVIIVHVLGDGRPTQPEAVASP